MFCWMFAIIGTDAFQQALPCFTSERMKSGLSGMEQPVDG
ncbi:hypothetical protein SynA1825c_01238 [Synechococcus sp. A18-25c]|nr:hypothetical protein SynA1825c_01238 [Synechococcus sp. A18-25c]